jgi:hypothetical protein
MMQLFTKLSPSSINRVLKAPKIVRVVTLSRKLARPNVASGYLPHGVTPVTELAEMFLRDYHAWKYGRAWFSQDRHSLYPRLTQIAKKWADKAASSDDPCEVAGEQACYHSCLAILHSHTALQQVVAGKSPSAEYRLAIEEVVLTHYYNLERQKNFRNLRPNDPTLMQIARKHVLTWLKEEGFAEED